MTWIAPLLLEAAKFPRRPLASGWSDLAYLIPIIIGMILVAILLTGLAQHLESKKLRRPLTKAEKRKVLRAWGIIFGAALVVAGFFYFYYVLSTR